MVLGESEVCGVHSSAVNSRFGMKRAQKNSLIINLLSLLYVCYLKSNRMLRLNHSIGVLITFSSFLIAISVLESYSSENKLIDRLLTERVPVESWKS